jgi:hypothetical protein
MKDLEAKYNKAVLDIQKIENQVNDKLWELTQKYPQAVIYTYHTNPQGDIAEVKALIFSTKRQITTLWIVDKFKHLKAIEAHIESLNPRKQLVLDLNDQK